MPIDHELATIHQEMEAISDKLCLAVKGEFNFTIVVHNPDESLQKLSMLINFVLDAARRALLDVTGKNEKLLAEINERKKIEEEARGLNSQLALAARRAGMSDIATSILHNVGNILNSANVSITLLQEDTNHSDFDKLLKIADLLKEHSSDMAQFLTQDAKGKLLPSYLVPLIKILAENREKYRLEIDNIATHIKHIEDIVSMQKAISGVAGPVEKFFVPDVIEDAVKICGDSLNKMGIELRKEFDHASFIMSDKSKVLQILINLIQNAKDSFLFEDYEFPKKTIVVKVWKIDVENPKVNIEVSDNGIGISS